MSTPTLVLKYFPLPGRAGAIRLALAYGKIPFTDDRIPFAEFGTVVKPSGVLPFDALPVLEVREVPPLSAAAARGHAGWHGCVYKPMFAVLW